MININRDKQTHRPMNTVNKHDYTNETDMSNESSLQMVTLLTNLYFKGPESRYIQRIRRERTSTTNWTLK